MEKTIDVNGRPIKFKSTAATLRIYRQIFQRDILEDMQAIQEEAANGMLSVKTLGFFEDIAYTMARQADPDIPATSDEWLDTFDIFDIYQILPQILNLWGISTTTLSESKKKALAQTDL